MRFVAGRGAMAERLQRGGAVAERLAGCAEEVLLAGPPLLQHREEIGKNLKSTSKPHTELLVEEGEEDSILFCNFGGKM